MTSDVIRAGRRNPATHFRRGRGAGYRRRVTLPGPLAPVLIGFVVLGLFALGLAGALLPRRAWMIMAGCAALCGVGALTAFVFLLAGAPAAGFVLPLGLPGTSAQLGLDALSGFFVLLLFVTGAACSVYALDPHGAEGQRALPFFPVFVGAMALTLLAADSFSLVFGFELMSLASWAMVLARHEEPASRDAALLYLGIAAFGGRVPDPGAGPARPARAARARPALRRDARRAARGLAGERGAGAGAARRGVEGGARAAACLAAARPSGGAEPRLRADVGGDDQGRAVRDRAAAVRPVRAGAAAVVGRAAAGDGRRLGGARRAARQSGSATSNRCWRRARSSMSGSIAIGLGLALAARAADLPALASLALGGALLHALKHGVFKTLLFLCAGAAQHGAGSRALARLGGLIHRMPVTTGCVLAGARGWRRCRRGRASPANGCCSSRFSPHPGSAGSPCRPCSQW